MSRKKKRTIPRWKKMLVAALAAAAAGAIGGGVVAATNINYFRGEKVINVIDGDTFQIENKQLVRLLSVYAPELGFCMASDAKNALSSMILNKRVQLREPLVDKRYGRVIALVYQNGIFINDVMLRAGLAVYKNARSSQEKVLFTSDMYARTNKVGIFSTACTLPEPPNPSCTIKGNVNTTTNQKDYYLPSCGHYGKVLIYKFEGDAWFCTEAEARAAGFTKSDTCK